VDWKDTKPDAYNHRIFKFLRALARASYPPYSPDRNPDELVWKHLKFDKVGRTSITCLDDFGNKAKSSMLSLQRDSGKSARCSTNPPSDTPPDVYILMYRLIRSDQLR
jgi:transposase